MTCLDYELKLELVSLVNGQYFHNHHLNEKDMESKYWQGFYTKLSEDRLKDYNHQTPNRQQKTWKSIKTRDRHHI